MAQRALRKQTYTAPDEHDADVITRRLAALVESSPDAMITATRDGRIVSWNDGAFRMYGYRSEEAIGRQLHMLQPPDVDEIDSLLARALAGEAVRDHETTRLRKDGSVVEIVVTYAPITDDDGVVENVSGVARDITDVRRARREAERIAYERDLVLRSVGDGIYMLDLEGRVTYVNPAACELLGQPRDELLGKEIHALAHHSYPDGAPYPRSRCPIHRTMLTGEPTRVENEVFWRRDGTSFLAELNITPVQNGTGLKGCVVIVRDVSLRLAAEREAREATIRFETAFRSAPIPIGLLDLTPGREGHYIQVNDAFCQMLGYSSDELEALSAPGVTHPDDLERTGQAVATLVAEGSASIRKRYLAKDGSVVWGMAYASAVMDGDAPSYAIMQVQDITEQVHAEEESRRSEETFQVAFDTALDAMFVLDDERRITRCNAAAGQVLGVQRALLLGGAVDDFVSPDQRAVLVEHWERLMAAGEGRAEFPFVRPDGSQVSVELAATARFLPGSHLVVARDITERRRGEEALRRSEEMLAKTERMNGTGSYDHDLRNGTVQWSAEAARIFGMPAGAPKYPDEWREYLHPGDYDRTLGAVTEGRGRGGGEVEFRIIRASDGQVRDIRTEWRVETDESERPLRVVGSLSDVTDARETERRVHDSEERFRRIVETANEGVWVIDTDGNTTFVNARMAEMLGAPADELIGRNVMDFQVDRDRAGASLKRRRAGSTERLSVDLKRADGTVVPTWLSASSISTSAGEYAGAIAMVVDLTDRLAAEEAQAQLQRRVEQMERLETVGQLAGGIAHDFNNLLAVILNYAEFALGALEGHEAETDIREIRSAAERAADLTHQLLVFSRREVVQPQALRLNDVIEGMESLLRRAVGEHIPVELHLSRRVPKVMADAGQLEQVLMNLAVNARDAMADGGRLAISTSCHDGDGGRIARLSVRDTGDGMTEDVKDHVFEPFFTTKAKGSGTGLGLATVYGIVAAAGGTITIDSTLGEGTTISVDLPAANVPPSSTELIEIPEQAVEPPTVLVVEDDEAVLRVASRILTEAGHVVLETTSPSQALEIAARREGRLDVVLTDVVMPEMSGTSLAERIHSLRPDAAIVFMSGYTEQPEKLPGGAPFIAKPFKAEKLVEQIRGALEEQPA